MESAKKRPHHALSLEKKLEILKELDRSGLTKTEVAKKFDIPKSTLSRILKNKETIEGAVKNGTFTAKRMRMRTTPYEELEKDYETIDESVQTCREETLEELIAEVQADDQPSSSDECDDVIPSAVVPPDSAAKEAVELLQRYFEHEGCPEFLSSLSGMGAYFVKKQLKHAKQTTLHSFFSPTHPDK
ncbi:hypothetical protein HPB52_009667 [Rhipicephalus sanguineus]|uniref:HTH psq-type domain-containing protein n=1 Tax=Rhipicephalus sanguineus TaxID=34632 RepID=A0A9D4SSJ9_RHISA|nr:hypothetical protein HPB52_009667 [Rhipicephalus sanguineus]